MQVDRKPRKAYCLCLKMSHEHPLKVNARYHGHGYYTDCGHFTRPSPAQPSTFLEAKQGTGNRTPLSVCYLSHVRTSSGLGWRLRCQHISAANASFVSSQKRSVFQVSAANKVILMDNGTVYSSPTWMAEQGLHLFQMRIRYTHEQIACLLKQMSALYLYFALRSLVCIWENVIQPALVKDAFQCFSSPLNCEMLNHFEKQIDKQHFSSRWENN